MYETILEFEDANTAVKVGVGINTFDAYLVRITESGRSICLTAEGLTSIADAVRQHLEGGPGPSEPEPLPLRDLEPALQAIAEYEEDRNGMVGTV